jgi:hypothetical protein
VLPSSELAGMFVSADTKRDILAPYVKLGITVIKASANK